MREVETFHMVVYNRWGRLLFETRDPKTLGWDGKDPDGKECPSDSYIYLIEGGFETVNEQFKGNVTLIR